jgi:hypothetical protein
MPIHFRVSDSRPVHTDVVVVADVGEFLPVNWVLMSVMIVLGMPKQ